MGVGRCARLRAWCIRNRLTVSARSLLRLGLVAAVPVGACLAALAEGFQATTRLTEKLFYIAALLAVVDLCVRWRTVHNEAWKHSLLEDERTRVRCFHLLNTLVWKIGALRNDRGLDATLFVRRRRDFVPIVRFRNWDRMNLEVDSVAKFRDSSSSIIHSALLRLGQTSHLALKDRSGLRRQELVDYFQESLEMSGREVLLLEDRTLCEARQLADVALYWPPTTPERLTDVEHATSAKHEVLGFLSLRTTTPPTAGHSRSLHPDSWQDGERTIYLRTLRHLTILLLPPPAFWPSQ